MQVNAGQPPRQIPKAGSSHFLPQQHSGIQIPMLGPNLQVQQKPPQNQLGPQQQQQADIQLLPQSGQDFNLSNVLHFLQTEWRRYERDRNEWEIERAEMRVRLSSCIGESRRSSTLTRLQARIALLEGERRSFDNVKLDLMRRIKMLEYALGRERCVVCPRRLPRRLTCRHHSSKQLNQPQAQGVPPAKLAAIQSHMGGTSQKDEDSSGSSPRSEGVCL